MPQRTSTRKIARATGFIPILLMAVTVFVFVIGGAWMLLVLASLGDSLLRQSSGREAVEQPQGEAKRPTRTTLISPSASFRLELATAAHAVSKTDPETGLRRATTRRTLRAPSARSSRPSRRSPEPTPAVISPAPSRRLTAQTPSSPRITLPSLALAMSSAARTTSSTRRASTSAATGSWSPSSPTSARRCRSSLSCSNRSRSPTTSRHRLRTSDPSDPIASEPTHCPVGVDNRAAEHSPDSRGSSN